MKQSCTHKVYQRDCYACWVKRMPTIKQPTGKDVFDLVNSIGIEQWMIEKLYALLRKDLEEEIRKKLINKY